MQPSFQKFIHSLRIKEMFYLEHRHVVYLFTFIIAYGIAVIVSRLVLFLLNRYYKRHRYSSDFDPTVFSFIKSAVSLVIYVMATAFVFSRIPALHAIGLTLFASAGIVAAIIGFASQAAFSNIISGIIIVLYKPFRVGDIVLVGKDYEGVVEDITMRHTIIRSYDNRRILIPNSVISGQVITNSSLTDKRICLFLTINISYGSDLEKALAIIHAEAEKHPLCRDHRTEQERTDGLPKVPVKVVMLYELGVQLRASIWADSAADSFTIKCDLLESLKQQFDKEGIKIPVTTTG